MLERKASSARMIYNPNAAAKGAQVDKINNDVVNFISNIPQTDINVMGSNTFLSIAAKQGSAVGIEALCKRGANPTKVSTSGESLSEMAEEFQSTLYTDGSPFKTAIDNCKPAAGGRRKAMKNKTRSKRRRQQIKSK
jgi:ankyrin repeat protein